MASPATIVTEARAEPKQALLDAAVRMLATKAPSAITGRELAEEAGCTYGLVHRHFGTKAALLDAANGQMSESLMEQLRLQPNGLPKFGVLDDHPELVRAKAFIELDQATLADFPARGPVVRYYLDALGAARPDLSTYDQKVMTALVVSLHLGLATYSAMLAPGLDLDPGDPEIAETVSAWVAGLHDGTGPLGNVPGPPRPLRRVKSDHPPVEPIGEETSQEFQRRRLVEAGATLLEDRAPTAISGRELATAASVNYGLIHRFFQSKEAVLQQSLQLQRDRFFLDASSGELGPDYFAPSARPGFVRAMSWAALDGLGESIMAPTFPTVGAVLAMMDEDAQRSPTQIRIGLLATTTIQLAWTLFSRPLEDGLDCRLAHLEPSAASVLHRILFLALAQ